jgi:hypothetical protein
MSLFGHEISSRGTSVYLCHYIFVIIFKHCICNYFPPKLKSKKPLPQTLQNGLLHRLGERFPLKCVIAGGVRCFRVFALKCDIFCHVIGVEYE